MKIQPSLTTISLLGMCLAVLMSGGCAALQKSATEEPSRRLDGAEAGERVTSEELDGLTRGFADRYVGLLYSVCDALKQDNPDPVQRQAAPSFDWLLAKMPRCSVEHVTITGAAQGTRADHF
ncbi:MAG: hypothetical protein R6U50_00810, partial [Desulfobacterales bacterium]